MSAPNASFRSALSLPQCYIAGSLFVVSAWVRYAGTTHGLTTQGSYALIMVGQVSVRSVSGPIDGVF